MSAGAKQKQAPAAEEISVETLLARAMVAAGKVVGEDRDPSPAESELIAAAVARAEVAGVEVGAAFAGFQRFVEHRAQLKAEAARHEEERRNREARRQDWLARPARFRALPDQVRLLHVVGQFLVADELLRGRDVLGAFEEARNQLMLPAAEQPIPYTFEPAIVAAAKRDAFTRDGIQHVGGDE